jgi:glycosyltransferase involved in cell wall biosynthesis
MAGKISGIVHHSFYASKFIGTALRAVIPVVKNSEDIDRIIKEIPTDIVKEIIIVIDPSVDETGKKWHEEGVTVLKAKEKGYGNACRIAIEYLGDPERQTDMVVFLNADYPVASGDLINVVLPIAEHGYDFVVGSEFLSGKKGKKLQEQPLGNRLAFALIRWLYGTKFTDFRLLRAIRYEQLKRINLRGKGDDWLLEIQVKAAKNKLKCREVSVDIAGNDEERVKTKEMSITKILQTVFKNI